MHHTKNAATPATATPPAAVFRSLLGYRLVIDSVTPFLPRQKALRLSYRALAQGLADPTLGAGAAEEVHHIHTLTGLDGMLDIERRTVERP